MLRTRRFILRRKPHRFFHKGVANYPLKRQRAWGSFPKPLFYLARPERFELPTPWFVAKYSIQLSYGRIEEDADYGGERGIRTLDGAFEPHTPLAGERLQPLGHLSGNAQCTGIEGR